MGGSMALQMQFKKLLIYIYWKISIYPELTLGLRLKTISNFGLYIRQQRTLNQEKKSLMDILKSTVSLSPYGTCKLTHYFVSTRIKLLFFQLSQRIQAKFIVKGYPPELLTTPWRELIAKGYVSPLINDENDLLLMKDVDPKGVVGRYGTDRDLTTEQVIKIVAHCREYQLRGGTVGSYYNDRLQPNIRDKFSFDTLKSWLKNKISLIEEKTHPQTHPLRYPSSHPT